MDYDVEARADAAQELAPIDQGGSGQKVTLKREIPGTRDPATGIVGPPTTQQRDGSGLEEAYRASEIDGTLIKKGDKKFMLAALDLTGAEMMAPKVGDTLVMTDGGWGVATVEPFSPAGLAIYFNLQLRK